ncbi:hypothetical protein [Methanococcoides sp. AM1]|uniref:hypothetical protein n=1 Tax=Methanococcoides sp. AM1 TaxID=1201011 RepID=UPI00143841B0|nr:hypothetical protein [Methanococcoides sp. AM1]
MSGDKAIRWICDACLEWDGDSVYIPCMISLSDDKVPVKCCVPEEDRCAEWRRIV